MQREGKRRGEGCALREGVEVVHAARHVERRLQLLRAVRPPALHIQLLVQRIARPAQAQEIQAPANDMSQRLGGPSDHSEQGRSISECGVAHSSSWTRTSSGLSAYPSSCTRFGWLRSPVRNGHIAGTLASMQTRCRQYRGGRTADVDLLHEILRDLDDFRPQRLLGARGGA